MQKRMSSCEKKLIFVIESPVFDCGNLLNKIGYDERFSVVNFDDILKTELSKETKLSTHARPLNRQARRSRKN